MPAMRSLGNWLFYLLAGLVLYFLLPARFRPWLLVVVLLGGLSRPGVMSRLKAGLSGG